MTVRAADLYNELLPGLDARTLEILDHRRGGAVRRRRGWLVRRALLGADIVGLVAAFVVATTLFAIQPGDRVGVPTELLIFLAVLPVWVLGAKLYGLYDQDEERADHSTLDEFTGVLTVVTVGSWIVFAIASWTTLAEPNPSRMFVFWGLAVALVVAGRATARTLCRRSVSYLQNTVIVGAGDVGQLVARKILQHPEYGIHLVGFLDARPKPRRVEVEHLSLLGPADRLPEIVRALDVERVIIAFADESHDETLTLIRSVRDLDLQVDLVPRLFEVVGPRVGIHTVEGLPLVGLPSARLSRSSAAIKRWIDVAAALVGLVLTAPLFAYVAWRIRRDSQGPVLFRQTRLGEGMREFTLLKFRTMKEDTDEAPHRDYIRRIATSSAAPEAQGIYKLERPDAVTRVGHWLRRTSLDELPQLINVLRGDMSLVGPRPCLPYETETFASHHFERFLVPAGLTGLWQVTARAKTSFGEALDMDVAYARGWSLGLDLKLLLRTPLVLLRSGGTA